jgi:hypothetical protein
LLVKTKWDLIKHNVSKFCGIYNQIQRMHKSGSSAADTLRDTKELYRQKNAKNTDFVFEHCWLLLKDRPRWADGWTQPPMGEKRTANECEGSNTQDHDVGISEGAARSQSVYNERPGGVKAAKQDNMQQKMRDGALYTQAEATRSMTSVQMKKVALIEDQNMLLLMTMPIEDNAREDAREYLRLRRREELKKLRLRLCAEESALQAQEAREIAVAEFGTLRQDCPAREWGGSSASLPGCPSADGVSPSNAGSPQPATSTAAGTDGVTPTMWWFGVAVAGRAAGGNGWGCKEEEE